jgi:hypothetical protein
MPRRFLLVLVHFVFIFSNLFGQLNYYVKPTGIDSPTRGLSPSTPFKTINYGVGQLGPGDTLNIMEGEYSNSTFGDYNFFKPQTDCAIYMNGKNGTATANIVVRRYKNDHVVLKGDGLAVIHVKNSSYVKIQNLEVFGEVNNIPLDTALQYQFLYKDENGILKYRMPPLSPPAVVEAAVLPILNANVDRPTYFNTMGIIVVSSQHVDVVDNYVHHMPGEGIRSASSDFIKFLRNEVHDCSRRSASGVHGMSIYTMVSGGNADTATIQMNENRIHHNYNEVYSWSSTKTFITPHFDEGKGITVQRCTGSRDWDFGRIQIQNNVCYRNGFAGIQVNEGDRVDILNNTLYKNHFTHELTGDGSQLGISAQTSQDIKIKNNIIVNDPTYTTGYALMLLSSTINIQIDKNILVGYLNNQAFNVDMNTLFTDPQFVNPSQFIFRLKSTSPAINTSITDAPPTDFYGKQRSGIADLGAIEYLTSCTLLVTIGSNDGIGTLRQIIDCAQEGDTIKFASGINSNITAPLYIDKQLTIIGNSSPDLTTIVQDLSLANKAQLIIQPGKVLNISNLHFVNTGSVYDVPSINVYGRLKASGLNRVNRN